MDGVSGSEMYGISGIDASVVKHFWALYGPFSFALYGISPRLGIHVWEFCESSISFCFILLEDLYP